MGIDRAKPPILVWVREEPLKGMVLSLLGGEGFETLDVSDQRAMFQFLEKYRPPVVILDADLPRIMGYEVYEVIKRIDRYKDIWIILLSSGPFPPLDGTGRIEYLRIGEVRDHLLSKIWTLLSSGYNDEETMARDIYPISIEDPSNHSHDTPSKRGAGIYPPSDPEIHEEARRLAKLILSDIVSYNKEKAERGAMEGTFRELLRKEIEEGREFYSRRVPQEVLSSTNYYDEVVEEYIRKMSRK